MTERTSRRFRAPAAAAVVVILLGVGIAAAAVWMKRGKEAAPTQNPADSLDLQLAGPDTLGVPDAVRDAMGIRTAPTVRARPRPLELYGQLVPNWDRLIRIRLRFPAQVKEITQITDHHAGGQTEERPLRVGDVVDRNQLLAVVYSTDLGAKKSEFVDYLSQLRTDEEKLKGYQESQRKGGAIAERLILDQKRQVQADVINVAKAENALRNWQVSDAEIASLRRDAKELWDKANGGAVIPTAEQRDQWAYMEVRAPPAWGGKILEKNVAAGEFIDPSANPPPLFQIADQSQMMVLAYCNEEDLSLLRKLPQPIHWTVRLTADPKAPPLESPDDDPRGPSVQQILPGIETNQRSPILQGLVKNPGGEYLSNMAVSVTIPVPPPPDVVEVPATALVDEGDRAYVFVQPDGGKSEYVMRRVAVAQRYRDVVYVRSRSSAADAKRNGGPKVVPLEAGQFVVVSGALEMKAALDELQSKAATGGQ